MRKNHGRNAQRRKGEQKERRGELRNARREEVDSEKEPAVSDGGSETRGCH